MSFDAVTELQQEVLFFKDRCVNCPNVLYIHYEGRDRLASHLVPHWILYKIIPEMFQITFCLFRFMWRKHPQFDETKITLISSLWPESVPHNLDAAYQNVEKNVNLFFKGKLK